MKLLVRLCLGLSCISLLSAGCTKKDLVRSDQPVTAAAAADAKIAENAVAGSTTPHTTAAAVAAEGADAREAAEREQVQPIQDAAMLTGDLPRIHFDFDSYLLSRQARDTLAETAKILMDASQLRVRIAGHCDERGSDDYNLALSERRAESAMQYLLGLGVPRERLSVIGYGKERPLAQGHDEASWAENRRDDFEIVQP